VSRLPNRARLHAAVDALVAGASSPSQASFALLVLDLDRFKEIRDALGRHQAGLLLQDVAERLDAVLGPGDLLARFGSDQFGVLLPSADVQRARDVTHHLLRALEQPFVVDGVTLDIAASVEIAVYPAHGDDAESLLRHARVVGAQALVRWQHPAGTQAENEPKNRVSMNCSGLALRAAGMVVSARKSSMPCRLSGRGTSVGSKRTLVLKKS
jgi:diguanylate cyclase (GGDEF)-like protein